MGPVYQAGTLSGNPLAMAAGLATLRRLARAGSYEKLEARSAQLAEGLRERAAAAGVELTSHAVGGIFGFFFHPGPVENFADASRADAARFRLFFAAMLDARHLPGAVAVRVRLRLARPPPARHRGDARGGRPGAAPRGPRALREAGAVG